MPSRTNKDKNTPEIAKKQPLDGNLDDHGRAAALPFPGMVAPESHSCRAIWFSRRWTVNGNRGTVTTDRNTSNLGERGRWDPLITELRVLRREADEPSYAEMTRRLIEQRMADGMDEHAARIAKSSVHDTFRLGRSRVNLPLVREFARVLGADPSVVDEWVAACEPVAPVQEPAEPVQPKATPQPATTRQVVLLLVGCLVLNLIGREFVDFFQFPIYLDMVGTAIAAIALGAWRGASVGLLTNLIGAIGSGWISIPFALVNVIGALVWGYGVRSWGMGRSLGRFFVLNLMVAFACTLVAVPILLTLVGDRLSAGHFTVEVLVEEALGNFGGAVALSNLLTSSADKLISGFFALVVISSLPVALRAGAPLVFVDHDNGSGSR